MGSLSFLSWLRLLRRQTPDSSALNVWTRCTTSASSSELELTTSGTTWPRTIAPQLKRTSRTSVLRSLPDTTSECWTPLSTTTSWTEPCTCARLWASVTHSGAAGTLVRSVSKVLNGWRTTSRTRSLSPSTSSTSSRTFAKTVGKVARSTLSRTSLQCTTWPWRSSSSPPRSATSRRSAGLPPRQSPHSREQTVLWKKIHLNKNQQRV